MPSLLDFIGWAGVAGCVNGAVGSYGEGLTLFGGPVECAWFRLLELPAAVGFHAVGASG